MRLIALAAVMLAAATDSPGAAQITLPPNYEAKIAAACGGGADEAQLARMPRAAALKKLVCFYREMAVLINRSLPVQVNDKTTLQRVSADGAVVTYHYSVAVVRGEVGGRGRNASNPMIKEKVCADQRDSIRLGMSFRYLWLDQNGDELDELLVDSC